MGQVRLEVATRALALRQTIATGHGTRSVATDLAGRTSLGAKATIIGVRARISADAVAIGLAIATVHRTHPTVR